MEKDGTGDFTVIQDALDAAAPGDSIHIGSGRFDDLRLYTSAQLGGTVAPIMVATVGPLYIVGAGCDSTIVGPATQVVEFMGHEADGFMHDANPPFVEVRGVWFANTAWPATLRGATAFRECRFSGGLYGGVALRDAQGVVFSDCEFLGPLALGGPRAITSFLGGENDSLRVRNCRFQWGGGINLVGSDGFEATDLIFENVRTPFQLSFASGTVRRVTAITLFSGYGINMADSQLRLEDSYFGEGANLTLDLTSNSALDAVNTHFGGGSDGTLVLASSATVSITASNILHQAPLTILTVMDPGPELIWNLENNYWGSTDSTEIASWILDGRDPGGTVQRPIVDFVPFLTQPVTVSQPSRSFGSLKSQFRQSPD